MLGGVRSSTVIVWIPLAALPHASVAVQVRLMILLPPHRLVVLSVKVTLTELQPSCPLAFPVALGAVLAPHSSVTSGGTVTSGGVVSRTVMVCVLFVLLPH